MKVLKVRLICKKQTNKQTKTKKWLPVAKIWGKCSFYQLFNVLYFKYLKCIFKECS